MTDGAVQLIPPPMQVGLVLPIGEDSTTRIVPRWSEIRAVAQQAEEANFDSVWLYDHLLFRRPEQPTRGIWEAWTLLAALGAATQRVRIGAIVLCTAFRNPALLAKMAATLDDVSDGRLILGLGAGWHEPEFRAFGLPFDHLASRFEEAMQIICPLLREGHVDFAGEYYSAPNCEILPRGPSARGPEIMVGAGKPRMLRITARYADSWNTCWLGDVSALAPQRAAVEEACRAEGRDPATLAITVGLNCEYRAPGAEGEPPPAEKAISGTPADVARALQGYADAGVRHVQCSLNEVHDESVAWLAEGTRIFRTLSAERRDEGRRTKDEGRQYPLQSAPSADER